MIVVERNHPFSVGSLTVGIFSQTKCETAFLTFEIMKKPTEAELEVLQVLWGNGAASVRLVNEELSKNREVVYTTTLKIMQNMTEKGLLKRDTSKRTHIYEAAVSREMIQEKFFDRFLDNVFGGSPLKLVMHTLGHDKTSADDLEEIKKLISELEKK